LVRAPFNPKSRLNAPRFLMFFFIRYLKSSGKGQNIPTRSGDLLTLPIPEDLLFWHCYPGDLIFWSSFTFPGLVILCSDLVNQLAPCHFYQGLPKATSLKLFHSPQ
jgi:hypothetical protein